MNIGIIGAGNMGTAMGRFWARGGHELMISFARGPEALEAAARSIGVKTRTGTPAQAADFGEVVLLATPYGVSAEALRAAGPLDGKIVFSCVNALKADLSGMAVGTTTSAAEELARLVPAARFVEAIPPFAEILKSGATRFDDDVPSVFCCADDADAKAVVTQLLREVQVDVVDAGPLRNARYLEPAMMLLVQLAYPLKNGPVGVKLLRQSSP
jgi:8-hydroxy-5-deazaflavin:NADPH oxidoreductase